MKKTLCIILLLFAVKMLPQSTITPQVINSAGSYRVDNATGISITDNVGEAFIQTVGPAMNLMISEGFLQPFIIVPGFTLNVFKSDVTCLDRQDGRISFDISSMYPKDKYTFTTSWLPDGTCPGNKCTALDSLAPETYSLAVYFTYTNSAGFVRQDSVKQQITITSSDVVCKVKIYSGVVPVSGDVTHNWHIGNIDMFPNNKVSIYNRWGNQVFSVEGYLNEDPERSFPKQDQYDRLTAGTYFYIIDLGDGSKLIKGWVELVKN